MSASLVGSEMCIRDRLSTVALCVRAQRVARPPSSLNVEICRGIRLLHAKRARPPQGWTACPC
eukprot:4439373-Alexandrium_andersonii.AAC.1